MQFFKNISNASFKKYVEQTSTYSTGNEYFVQYHYKTQYLDELTGEVNVKGKDYTLSEKISEPILALRGVTLKKKGRGFIEFAKSFPSPAVVYNMPKQGKKKKKCYVDYKEGTILTVRRANNGELIISTHRKISLVKPKNFPDNKVYNPPRFVPYKKTFMEMMEDVLEDQSVNSAYQNLLKIYPNNCFVFMLVHEDNQLTYRTFDKRGLYLLDCFEQKGKYLQSCYNKVLDRLPNNSVVLLERYDKTEAKRRWKNQMPVVYYDKNSSDPINYFPKVYDDALNLRDPQSAVPYSHYLNLSKEEQEDFKELLPEVYAEVQGIDQMKNNQCREFKRKAIKTLTGFFEYVISIIKTDDKNVLIDFIKLSSNKRPTGKRVLADKWLYEISQSPKYIDLKHKLREINFDPLLKNLYYRVPSFKDRDIIYELLYDYIRRGVQETNITVQQLDNDQLKPHINKILNFVTFVDNKSSAEKTEELTSDDQ